MENLKLYTVHEVAKLLNTTPRTIRQYISDSKITATKIGRQWHVKEQEVIRFINSNNSVMQEELEQLKKDIREIKKDPTYKDIQKLREKYKELTLEVILDNIQLVRE